MWAFSLHLPTVRKVGHIIPYVIAMEVLWMNIRQLIAYVVAMNSSWDGYSLEKVAMSDLRRK